jgi:hypothetical protein
VRSSRGQADALCDQDMHAIADSGGCLSLSLGMIRSINPFVLGATRTPAIGVYRMQKGSSWSSIATVLVLIIVAVTEALQQAFANAPRFMLGLPGWTVSLNWNVVPLVLLTLAGVPWLIGHAPFRANRTAVASSSGSVNLGSSASRIAPQTSQASERIFVDIRPQQLLELRTTYCRAI